MTRRLKHLYADKCFINRMIIENEIKMPLRIGKKRKIFEGKYLVVWEKEFYDKNGIRRTWEYIERKKVIFIFPITSEQKVVLIKNFRVPLEKYVIEIPAGLKDIDGESDEKSAKRELLEETGYSAKNLIPISSWPYRSGSSNGVVSCFAATGLTKVTDKVGDATEDLTVVEVPMNELMDFYIKLPEDVLFTIEILGLHKIITEKGIKG